MFKILPVAFANKNWWNLHLIYLKCQIKIKDLGVFKGVWQFKWIKVAIRDIIKGIGNKRKNWAAIQSLNEGGIAVKI